MMRTHHRGFTLIELLVASASASVVMAAAVSLFVTLASQQRLAERLVEANASSMLALSTMQLDIGNAGYRFPVPAFAVRTLRVGSATSIPSVGSSSITTGANCGAGGLVESTDVLELATGFELAGPGAATSAAVMSGADVQFTLGNRGEPFFNTEASGGASAPGVGSVLLFANAAGASCLVKVTQLSSTGTTSGRGTLIDRDYLTVGAPSTFYPSCPASGMKVYRLGMRVRYMVCAPVGASPNQFALYRQVAGPTGLWNSPLLLENGVEDLQVSLGYSNADGAIAALGSASTCLQTGGAASSICYCDDKSSGACTLGSTQVEPGLSSIVPGIPIMRVRGIRVQLTSLGQRLAQSGEMNTQLRRPESFDHPGMTVSEADNYLRVQQQFGTVFHNFQVAP